MSKSIRYYFFTSIATVLVASVLAMGLIQTYLASAYFRQEKETLLEHLVTSVTNGTIPAKMEKICRECQENVVKKDQWRLL